MLNVVKNERYFKYIFNLKYKDFPNIQPRPAATSPPGNKGETYIDLWIVSSSHQLTLVWCKTKSERSKPRERYLHRLKQFWNLYINIVYNVLLQEEII